MQNAYDSHQFTQPIGSDSLLPAEEVHVASGEHDVEFRLASVGATLLSSEATHPDS
jgi:hypothetical protein